MVGRDINGIDDIGKRRSRTKQNTHGRQVAVRRNIVTLDGLASLWVLIEETSSANPVKLDTHIFLMVDIVTKIGIPHSDQVAPKHHCPDSGRYQQKSLHGRCHHGAQSTRSCGSWVATLLTFPTRDSCCLRAMAAVYKVRQGKAAQCNE